MRFLHLGDLHIGKSVNDFSMIDDQKYILNQILSVIDEQNVDALLIAGDIYDKSVPSEEAVKVCNEFICALAEQKIKTFLISGNHDSDERLNFGSPLFETTGIYIASKYEGRLSKQTLEDEYGPLHIYLLPFVKASQVRHYFPEEAIDSYDGAVRFAIKKADIDKKARNLIVAHQFVAGGGGDPEIGGSESAAVLTVGAVERVGADCFADFDYAALGHIHSPQSVGRDTVRYAGSPLKYSVSEITNDKSVPLITIGKKGEVSVELIALKPRREMRRLKGRLEQLLDRKKITDTDDYIYVTLTDEAPVPNAMDIIRGYYPNVLKLDYDNSYTKGTDQGILLETAKTQSFEELISDFYRMRFGTEISEEEMGILFEAAQEAGIPLAGKPIFQNRGNMNETA